MRISTGQYIDDFYFWDKTLGISNLRKGFILSHFEEGLQSLMTGRVDNVQSRSCSGWAFIQKAENDASCALLMLLIPPYSV